jgi:hypothetical protein
MLPENTQKYFEILVRTFIKNVSNPGGDPQMLYNILNEFQSNVLVDEIDDEEDKKNLETHLSWLSIQLIMMSVNGADQR